MTLSIHIACAVIYVVSTRKPPLLITSVPLPILYMSIIILKFQNNLAICLRVGCNACPLQSVHLIWNVYTEWTLSTNIGSMLTTPKSTTSGWGHVGISRRQRPLSFGIVSFLASLMVKVAFFGIVQESFINTTQISFLFRVYLRTGRSTVGMRNETVWKKARFARQRVAGVASAVAVRALCFGAETGESCITLG